MTDHHDLKLAQEIQFKLEFYLVALAFTVAGFAMQTGKFSGAVFSDLTETSSWILLTASGTIGLWRMEYAPVFYRVSNHVKQLKQDIKTYADHPEHASSVAGFRREVNEHGPWLRKFSLGNVTKYRWQKLLLVIGLGALIVARFAAQGAGLYW
jgi:hypothetical protein